MHLAGMGMIALGVALAVIGYDLHDWVNRRRTRRSALG